MQMTKSGASERRATRLVFLLCGMAHSSWAPLVPYAKARVHTNDQYFGLLLLCFGAGSMLSMPAMGALVSRYGCKRLIQISAGAIFLGLMAASVAPSSVLLALSLFLFGASIGAIDVVMNGAGLSGRDKSLARSYCGLSGVDLYCRPISGSPVCCSASRSSCVPGSPDLA